MFFPLSVVSQCNISLKKQRSRSIFSTLFCCFRDYNVEPPSSNSTGTLPPLVEENGGLQKVNKLAIAKFMLLNASFMLISCVKNVIVTQVS